LSRTPTLARKLLILCPNHSENEKQTPLLTVPSRPSLRKHTFYGILALVSLLGLGITQSARANYIVTMQEVGSNVVATGSGAFNLMGLNSSGTGASVAAADGDINTGLPSGASVDFYSGFTGPTSFGSGDAFFPNTGSGDLVGIAAGAMFPKFLVVPQGYASGTALSDSMTFNNNTFASLGVTPGTYVWTWGTVMNADSFTLQIGPAGVPDAGSTLSLFSLASLGLVALRRKLRC